MNKSAPIFLIMLIGAIALVQASTIWTTDIEGLPKYDYSPLETVYIHGTGFSLDSNVIIGVTRPNDFVEVGTAHTDQSGNFVYLYNIGSLLVYGTEGTVGEYSVLANDGTNTAETEFADAAIWTTLDDCGGSSQNINYFGVGEHVFINGEGHTPGATGTWEIKGNPGGSSCDPNTAVASGSVIVSSTGSFCIDAYIIQADDCGIYQTKFMSTAGDNYRVGCVDRDGDGYNGGPYTGACPAGTDCDDSNSSIYPGATELCDGKDNDCDGSIDESLTRACSNACFSGAETCSLGVWGSCSATPLPTGYGNSCGNACFQDGKIGCSGLCEGATPLPTNYSQVCYAGIGECRAAGAITCLGTCNAVPLNPGTELCDGKDNDCDSEIDEGCGCVDGQTMQCGETDVGECSYGEMTCSGGAWGLCVGAVDLIPEICDGLDNDCDGQIDNGLTRDCSNLCFSGTESCIDGKYGTCSATPLPTSYGTSCGNACFQNGKIGCFGTCEGATPLPTNYKDFCGNICFNDGRINCFGECIGETSIPETYGNICYVGLGVCRTAGTLTCTGTCNAVPPNSGTETCDGLDNDCDGETDEGCSCREGSTQPCGSSNVGECTYGTQTCTNGIWAECVGETNPIGEICWDELDNDCNGETDEDCHKSVSVMSSSLFALLAVSAALLGIYGIKKYGKR